MGYLENNQNSRIKNYLSMYMVKLLERAQSDAKACPLPIT